MPNFTSYVETDVDVEIDVEEFIEHCSNKEIAEMIQILSEDGHISSSAVLPKNYNALDQMWYEKIEKLQLNRLSLTNEEIELIEKIAGRF